MHETETMTDDITDDMRRLIDRIEQSLNGKPPSASGLTLLTAMNALTECVYQHQLDERMTELMRLADSFGQAAPLSDR